MEVDAQGPAAKAGLQVGDEILRWNNADVPRRLERWTGQQSPGTVLRLRIRRDDGEKSLEFHLGELRERSFQVVDLPDADARARALRDGILHGTTDPVTANR